MYAGIITKKRTIKRLGIHQRFNGAAYKMIEEFLAPGSFPQLKDIHHFEGVNGPDGLKLKADWKTGCNHIYDPEAGEGDVPLRIESHYDNLVSSLKSGDLLRAAFEASWLAHFITDGLTPAHHYPLDTLKQELFGPDSKHSFIKRHFHWFTRKGAMSTHLNFEAGISIALLMQPIRSYLDGDKLAQARRLGPLAFFQQEAREIANLRLYDKFCTKGWTAEIARAIKEIIAPQASHVIGIVWLLAYLEAEQDQATGLQLAPAIA